eukprot:gene6252-1117_t
MRAPFRVLQMAAAASAVLPHANPGRGTLMLVDQTEYPLAACLDGSPPAFYFRAAPTKAGRSKYLVYHDGGDFCGYGRGIASTAKLNAFVHMRLLGSSKSYVANSTKDLYASGIDAFANDPSSLAYEWNWVYMLYCDGHYYAGANTSKTVAPVPRSSKTEELFFRGRYNVQSVLGSIGLTPEADPREVSDVLLHGCSSGAVAVFANADHMRGLLPARTRVGAAANSGYYMNTQAHCLPRAPRLSAVLAYAARHDEEVWTEYWTKPPYMMANLTSTLNPSCVSSPAQSRYDSNQLYCANVDPANHSAVNEYGQGIEDSLGHWVSSASHVSLRAAFVDGCYSHCSCASGIRDGNWTP